MEYVPGLKPQQEGGQSGGRRSRKEGRTQVKEPQSRVSLRPSASPGNYYNRPAQPKGNQKSEQLIAALGQVSDVSQKLGQYMYEKQKKEAELQAKQEIQSMSLEEASAKVKSGEIGKYDNPYFQDSFQRQYGIRLGLHKGREMRTRFEEGFDPRTDNVDDFIQSHLDPEMEQMSDNPIIQEAFTETVDQDVQKLRTEDYSRKAAAMEQDSLDGAYETGVAQFEKRLADATTPEERQQAIEQGHKAWRDGYAERRELLGLSNAEQDTLTMQMAARFAREGNVDVVEKLLTDERGGVGAILDKRGEAGADAAQILNTAKQQFQQDNEERSFDTRMSFWEQAQAGKLDEDQLVGFHKQNPGAYTDAKVQSLISANRSAQDAKRNAYAEGERERALTDSRNTMIQDLNENNFEYALKGGLDKMQPREVISGYDDQGNPEYEIMSVDDQRELMVDTFTARLLPKYGQQFDDPEVRQEEMFKYEAEFFSKNPELENPRWKRQFDSIDGTISDAAAAGEEEDIPDRLRRAYGTYKELSAMNPGLVNGSTYLNSDERETMEALRISEEYLEKSFPQAIQNVAQINANEDVNSNPQLVASQYQKVEEKLNDLDVDYRNTDYVTTELRRLGRYFSRVGGSGALDHAQEVFDRTHANVNGHAVRITGSKTTPPKEEFEKIAQQWINRYARDHEDELDLTGMEPKDLTVKRLGDGDGNWVIVDEYSGSPVEDRVNGSANLDELKREFRKDTIRQSIAGEERRRDIEGKTQLRGPNGPIDMSHMREEKEEKEAPAGGLTAADRAATSDDAVKMSEDLGQLDPHKPAVGAGKAPLPDDMSGMVKDAITKLRDAGITQDDFDGFLKKSRGTAVQMPGGYKATFAMNPTMREKVRQYLPSA